MPNNVQLLQQNTVNNIHIAFYGNSEYEGMDIQPPSTHESIEAKHFAGSKPRAGNGQGQSGILTGHNQQKIYSLNRNDSKGAVGPNPKLSHNATIKGIELYNLKSNENIVKFGSSRKNSIKGG